MLQQTQASRVVLKYLEFLERFPDVTALSQASLRDVLALWQGLGYNRRAKALWETARILKHKHKGKLPPDTRELRVLPGIGPYTAAALAVFAFEEPAVVIETNIRTVYIHHFFVGRDGVSDQELKPVIEKTLDVESPRRWLEALMDYGAYLKRIKGNLSRKSKHYVRQTAFAGSDREIRGRIIKTLVERKRASRRALLTASCGSQYRISKQLARLVEEGLVKKERQLFTLP